MKNIRVDHQYQRVRTSFTRTKLLRLREIHAYVQLYNDARFLLYMSIFTEATTVLTYNDANYSRMNPDNGLKLSKKFVSELKLTVFFVFV